MASPGETRNARNRATFLRNIITVRLINAWWLATFFQPDEFFQSLEPAWKLAFGPDSGAWLTWVRALIYPSARTDTFALPGMEVPTAVFSSSSHIFRRLHCSRYAS